MRLIGRTSVFSRPANVRKRSTRVPCTRRSYNLLYPFDVRTHHDINPEGKKKNRFCNYNNIISVGLDRVHTRLNSVIRNIYFGSFFGRIRKTNFFFLTGILLSCFLLVIRLRTKWHNREYNIINYYKLI